MKKLLFILIVLLFSCEKKQEYCWKCAWDAGYTTPQIICEKSEKEIRQYEIDNTFKSASGYWIHMDCQRY